MPVKKMETKIFKKIAEIPPEIWNGIFPDTVEGYNFYKTLDESGFNQFKFRYILVYDNGLPVGAAPCFLMDFPLDAGMQGPAKRFSGFIKRFLPAIFNIRTLLCGLPMDRGQIGLAGGDTQGVISAICCAMETIAQGEGARFIAFKDFDKGYQDALKPLLKKGFFKIEDMPSTAMALDFRSFEEYLQRLSPASRYDLRRKFRRVGRRAEIKMQAVERLSGEELDAAYGLYLQTVNRQDIGFEVAPKEFFRLIPENMPGQSKFFLWQMNDKLAGFALCLFSGGYFIDIYLGFDYAVAYQHHLYFVKIRDLFIWAVENGFKTYEMGITNYEPKKRLDFEFIPLYIYARHRNRLLNLFFKAFGRFLAPANFDPTLKAIRKAGKF